MGTQDQGWLSDNAGRIQNISLAPNSKNAIYPLFEAVMNSIHAIEERFGPDNLADGRITIQLLRNVEGEYTGFTITDNGVGFNTDNLTSLRKFDSRKKAKIGGKGVGRLLWLKVANNAEIKSNFVGDDGQIFSSRFIFTLENPITDYEEAVSIEGRIETSVTISPYKSEFASRLPKKANTFANRLIAHFVSYFTNISHPEIKIYDVVGDDLEIIDLFDIFTEKVERDHDFSFGVDGISDSFMVHCFLLPKTISDDEKSVNALYLGANGRAVTRHELDSVLGMKAIGSRYAFLGYVESGFLNENANDTRTTFSLDEEQVALIVDAAKNCAKQFLAPEIREIRQKQAAKIIEIGKEHPRFFYDARHADAVADNLHLYLAHELLTLS